MLRLVLHHTYRSGRAADVSGNGNHGVPLHTTAGSGDYVSALRFEEGGSDVRVAPSATLSNLDAIQVQVRFQWDPDDGGLNRRHNLIEGHVSFALFITPRGGLMGTIVDGRGDWRGSAAAEGVVKPRVWHTAELRHDGAATLELRLDGALVAAAYDIPGPVRSVGNNGVAVGHWPEPSPQYTLRGWIDDVKLARHEIDASEIVDPCCTDWKVLDEEIKKAKSAGFGATQARELLARARALEAEIRTEVIGGDSARARRASELAALGGAAVEARDSRATVAALVRSWTFMLERISEDQLVAFGTQALDLLAEAPGGHALTEAVELRDVAPLASLGPVAGALCFPRLDGSRVKVSGDEDLLQRPLGGGDPDTDVLRPIPPAILTRLEAERRREREREDVERGESRPWGRLRRWISRARNAEGDR